MSIINIQIDIPNGDIPDATEAFKQLGPNGSPDIRTPKQMLVDEINRIIRQKIRQYRARQNQVLADSTTPEPNIAVS